MNNFSLAVILGTLLTIGSYLAGRTDGMKDAGAKYQVALTGISAEHSKQLAIATAAARQDEQRKAAAQAAIDRNVFKELSDEKRKTAALSAAVTAGTVQLRQRFTCPASASGDVPSTATSTSPGDATAPGGLQREDAQFFIQLASEADQVAIQLKACQAIVASDRTSAADLVD